MVGAAGTPTADDDDDDVADDNNADNVGSVVMAEDPDPNTDPLIYTLSGADAGFVQSEAGQRGHGWRERRRSD